MSSIGQPRMEGPNLDDARDAETEILLKHFAKNGVFIHSTNSMQDEMDLDCLEVSPISREVGKRVRDRVASLLGLSSLGSYIMKIRKDKGIAESDVTKNVKIAREVLSQIERDEMAFSDLSPKKAADLFELLDLNLQLVLGYLQNSLLADNKPKAYGSFYRLKSSLDKGQNKNPPHELPITFGSESSAINKFISEFLEEIQKRDLN